MPAQAAAAVPAVTRFYERERLLAAATEDERVAAF
jgi:hypothetical protein